MLRNRFAPRIDTLETRVALDAAPDVPAPTVDVSSAEQGVQLPDIFPPYPVSPPASDVPGLITLIGDGLGSLWDAIVSYGTPPGPSAPDGPAPVNPGPPALAPAPTLAPSLPGAPVGPDDLTPDGMYPPGMEPVSPPDAMIPDGMYPPGMEPVDPPSVMTPDE